MSTLKRISSILLVMCLTLSVPAVAEGSYYVVTKKAAGAQINGADTALSNQPYSFHVAMPDGGRISRGYVDLFGKTAVNKNTGEGRVKSTVFLPETADTTALPQITMQADDSSPLKGMLPYKRVITDSLYTQGSTTTFSSSSIANQLSNNPATVSFGFWIKESDVNTVFGNNPFTFWPMYKNASYMVLDLPLKTLIETVGNERNITPSGAGLSNLVTGIDIKAACLHRDNGWAYIVCNMENITYNSTFTSTGTLFYTLFNNVTPVLRIAGNKIEFSNFTYLTGAKIESGYTIYPDSELNTSFRHVLNKNITDFTIPASLVTGNMEINVYASECIGNSYVVSSKTVYDKYFLAENKEIMIEIAPNGNNLLNLKCDGTVLAQNVDYTVNNHIYEITSTFLNNLAVGEHTMCFEMDYGANVNLNITVENSEQSRPVVCAVDGTNIAVRTEFSNEKDLVQMFTGLTAQNMDNNNPINFSTSKLIDKSQPNMFAVGQVLSSGSDEASPFNYNNSYIGANHGQSNGVLVTCTSHGKTYADIGSLWTDQSGTKWNLLKIVNANQLLFLSDNLTTNINKYSFKASITGNLTYFSHGVNTSGITVSSQASSQQVYPAIRYKTREVYVVVDGTRYRLQDKETAYCDYVDIVEKYDIINPATIGNALRANRPTGGYTEAQNLAVGDAMIDYNMTYRIASDGTVLSIFHHTILNDVTFSYYGGIQYGIRENTFSGGVHRYIPKTKPFTVSSISYDFTQPYNVFANAVPTFTLIKDYWAEADFPPDREIDYMRDANGNNIVGFAGGYLPILDAMPQVRKNKTNAWGFLYTSKKTYPYFVTAAAFPSGTANQSIRGVAYKKFQNMNLSNHQIGSMYTVPFENDTYLYLDYHTSGTDSVSLPEYLQNKRITLVEKSANASYAKENDHIDVTVSNSLAYGYLVLKIGEDSISIKDSVVVNKADKTAKAIYYNNNYDTAQMTGIAASYQSGRLVEVKVMPINVAGKSEFEQTFAFENAFENVKILGWENINNLSPICQFK